jgi:hypothetical protein
MTINAAESKMLDGNKKTDALFKRGSAHNTVAKCGMRPKIDKLEL